jgi:hypothetical protein
MPAWQPDWQDVRWDQAASARAASELRRIADEIDRSCFERGAAAEQATREWRGAHRRKFDDHLREAMRQARALAEEYRIAAARIDQAAQRAREEQTRRVRERERWRLEKESEDRRRKR